MQTSLKKLGWLLLPWALLAALGCGSSSPDGPSRVLIITIDTWRWDHLGVSGRGKATTPTLDGLARRGAYLTRAVATAPTTTPSHASIFTGLIPPRHGVRANGQRSLDDRFETLAERFSHGGFTTAAFVSAYTLVRRFGLAQGFADYFDELPPDKASGQNMRQTPGEETVARFQRWLAEREDGERWLAWVHLFEPHQPYNAPGTPAGAPPPLAYRLEVERADALVKKIIDSTGTGDDLLVCVLSDHGEGLGEHDEASHGLLAYESTIRVPWLIAGPGVPAGRKIGAPVSVADALPTVLDLAGLPPVEGIDGRSLVPLLRGKPLPEKPVYFEAMDGALLLGLLPIAGATETRYKLIRSDPREAYDLTIDRAEATNLLAGEPSLGAAEAIARLDAYVRQVAAPVEKIPVDEEAAGALAALGYLKPQGPAASETKPMHPREYLRMGQLLERGREARRAGDLERSVDLLEQFRARFPEHGDVYNELGLIAGKRGQLELARDRFAMAIARNPYHVNARINLSGALFKLNDPEGSRRELEKLLEIDPDDTRALFNLGFLCLESFRDAACVYRRWERFLELAPNDPEAGQIRTTMAQLRGY